MSIGATGRGYANPVRNFGTARLLSGVGVAALVIATLSASPAIAQTWTGTTSNDWTVGTNWTGGTVPAAGTVVINTNSPNPTVLGVSGPAVGTTGQLIVGNLGGSTGNLTIQNGSALTSTTIVANPFVIGSGAGTTGIVTVTGAGSQWTTSGSSIRVGSGGNGTLNIQNGGTVFAPGVILGVSVGAGTLNISGGTLETTNLGRASGGGTGQVNFDGATLRAGTNNNFFIAGFSAGDLNIAAGGLTVDTQAFTVRAGSEFSGVGGLTKTGTGTLTLQTANTYAGETVIQTGTLALGTNGSIAASSRVVANGTFNISGITGTGASIQSLAGSGSVTLGAKNLTITNANDTFSGVISGTGALTLTGGTQTLSGVNTYSGGTAISGGTLAVSSDAALGAAAGAVTFNGGALRALASFATNRTMNFTSVGGIDVVAGAVLTVNGPMTGAGGLTKLGEGALLQNSVTGYLGGTVVAEGTLQAGAAGVFAGSYMTLADGTLDLNGFDQTIVNLQNSGRLRLGGAPGTMLTMTGGYLGMDGIVELNVALGDDTSATDRLVVNGDTGGNSSLVVTNVGGAGAQTGSAGIKVVDVLGASNGTFSLIGDYVFEGDQAVVGGAYAYRLYKGTETTADGDWYLRSEIIDAGPLYAPTVPLYENYANVLQAFNELGTLQQRVGSREWLNGGQAGEQGAVAPDAIWARMDASQAHFEPGVSTTGASYDVSTWRLQAGMDGVLQQGEAGSLVAGLNAQFGTVSSDIASLYGAGSINALGYGVGGTLTWYGAGGFYLDGQAQATWYSADIVSDDTGTTLVEGNDAFGYGLSLEAGQKIGLDANWSLTPQAQLSYSAVRFNDFTDQYDGTVSLNSGDTLVGRLGLSADYEDEWRDASGATNRTHLYGIANLYYDFLDGTSVDVSGTEFVSQNQGLWGGVGVGGSLSWADEQYSVFGEALVRGSVEDFGGNNAVGAKVGFSGKW